MPTLYIKDASVLQALQDLDYITFSTESGTPEYAQGRLYWDDYDQTLALMLANTSDPVTLQIGQEIHVYARNNTASDIPNGTVVLWTGSVGERITIAPAQADSVTGALIFGITTQEIAKNGIGFVTTFGLVRDFDTQTPGWAEGDLLYLSATVAGSLQNTVPTSGYTEPIARVIRRHPVDGVIFVRPRFEPAVGDVIGGNYTEWRYNGTQRQFGTARLGWQKYTANSVTLTTGTSADGVANLRTAHDGLFYHIDEVVGAPGFDLIVDFVSVTGFNWVEIIAGYVGSATHAAAVQLYNWVTTAWDTFHGMQTSYADVTTVNGYILNSYSFFLRDDDNYIGTGGDAGKVRVRFYHTPSGNSAHDAYFDVVALYQ